jgi:hypothetical protein
MVAKDKILDGIDAHEWWEHEDPLLLFPEESSHFLYRVIQPRRSHPLRRRMRQMAPVVAGIGALALVAVITLLAVNEVRSTFPASAEVETTVEQDQTASITPPAHVPVPDRLPSRTEAKRPDVVKASLPAAPRQAVVDQPARASSPRSITESARTGPPIADALASETETLPARILPVEAGPSPVAAVEAPPPAAIPSPAVLATVAADSGAPAPSLLPSTRMVAPSTAIESVLDRYALAFSMLDVKRAKTVWPGVNERNLERAFGSLQMQEFDLGACDIAVTPPRAVATCSGSARYVPKVGTRNVRSEQRRWTFRLQQRGQDWSIDSVDTQ